LWSGVALSAYFAVLCCAVREEKCFFIMKQFWGNDRLFLLLFFVIFRQNAKILCPL